MPKGKPPRPTKLQVDLRGDPSKRRRNTVEPEAPEGWPVMPQRFNDDPIAAAEWQSVCGHLESMSLLAVTDRAILELYCATYSLYRQAEERVKKYGDIVLVGSNKDHPQVSPWYTARNKYLDDCRRLLIEFGMSPSARARMRISVDDKTDKSWADLMQVVG